LIRGEKAQAESPALSVNLEITAQEDEARPGKATVARDLFRTQEQPPQALGCPARPLLAAGIVPRRPLPKGDTNGTDQRESQDQEGPFAGLPLRWSDCHCAVRLSRSLLEAAVPFREHQMPLRVEKCDCEG